MSAGFGANSFPYLPPYLIVCTAHKDCEVQGETPHPTTEHNSLSIQSICSSDNHQRGIKGHSSELKVRLSEQPAGDYPTDETTEIDRGETTPHPTTKHNSYL